MLGEKALALVKEAHQSLDALAPYNTELVKEVSREIICLTQDNQRLVQENDEAEVNYLPTVRVQHAAIQRDMRCLVAYHYNRLRRIRNMRWEFGSILPPDVKGALSSAEFNWFKDYNRTLANYMRRIGGEGGVNLCIDIKPPKSLYTEVKCLTDYGMFELSTGTVINLKNNTRYFLPQIDCEEFIRQGIFQHIIS